MFRILSGPDPGIFITLPSLPWRCCPSTAPNRDPVGRVYHAVVHTDVFQRTIIMDAALYNTLLIAFLSALIATIIGTAAAIGLSAMKNGLRTICMGLNNIPMLNSDIVTGISLMLDVHRLRDLPGLQDNPVRPYHLQRALYVMLSVMPKLKQTSRNTYEAAMDLGAGPLGIFQGSVPGYYAGCYRAF